MDNKGAWACGCAVEVVVVVLVASALSTDQGASLFLYMMLMSVPVAIIRWAFFDDSTPKWMRVFIGPAGMLLCLLAAWLFPIHVEETTDKADGEITTVGKDAPPEPAPAAPAEPLEAVLADLDGLVGIEGIKAEVRKLVNLAKINEARRKQGLKTPPMTYHMAFTGNPGTGKTTVARIVARILHSLGVISRG